MDRERVIKKIPYHVYLWFNSLNKSKSWFFFRFYKIYLKDPNTTYSKWPAFIISILIKWIHMLWLNALQCVLFGQTQFVVIWLQCGVLIAGFRRICWLIHIRWQYLVDGGSFLLRPSVRKQFPLQEIRKDLFSDTILPLNLMIRAYKIGNGSEQVHWNGGI